jgi:hypothetical protein
MVNTAEPPKLAQKTRDGVDTNRLQIVGAFVGDLVAAQLHWLDMAFHERHFGSGGEMTIRASPSTTKNSLIRTQH